MMAQMLNRFEWIKAVMQVETLSATTRLVASALAIQFANDKTGQINPSQETITDYLKVHPDTVKRALRELRKAGWLTSLSDGGRGKSPKLRLLSPSTTLPPHYKEEQYKEQKGRDPRKTRWNSHRFIGNLWYGFCPIKSENRDALSEWGRWLKSHDLPVLYSLPLQAADEKSGSKFFLLPWRTPPNDEPSTAEALAFFADMLEPNEVRYAAE